MTNSRIADVFDEMADLLEFQNANAFRVRAYRNGARVIRDMAESVASIVADDPKKLQEIDGIGKGVAEKCVTLVETGELPQLNELLAKVPESVLALLRIPGLGPKKAAVLFNDLGIKTLEELASACEEGRVRELKGFGARTEQVILKGMAIAEAAGKRVYWAKADETAAELKKHLSTCKSVEQLEFAGSYRRGRETIGDLDILVVSEDAGQVMDRLAEFPDLSETIGRGDTKMSIRMHDGFQVDLRVVPAESFGAALQYFTGSKDHNVVLRGLAKQRGLKINEWGVFRVKGKKETYIAGATEEDVYATLDLPVFPPELRESRGEFDAAESDELPRLIELKDIRGDLHMHTTATDGKASLGEMANAAKQRGLKYIAITDHSKHLAMTNGLDAERLREQWKEIDRLNDKLGNSLTVLKGIECDVLDNGEMDLPDDVLADADWVLASVHTVSKQSIPYTDRMIAAIENKNVSAIAHPTGRLINQREPYDVDLEEVFLACKQHGKLLELNANPQRLDLNDIYCASAKSHGIPIVISTDAHAVTSLDMMKYGILQARRAGLEKSDVANTRTWLQMKKLIGKN